MPYLTAAELNTSLYPEIQSAISRGQSTTIELHINEALSFVQAKLSTRYDMIAEFQKTGADRNNLLLKFIKDIAIYYLYDLPETIPSKRVKAHDDAIDFINDLVKGQAVLAGVPPAQTDDDTTTIGGTISYGSEQKRNNRLN